MPEEEGRATPRVKNLKGAPRLQPMRLEWPDVVSLISGLRAPLFSEPIVPGWFKQFESSTTVTLEACYAGRELKVLLGQR